MRLTGSALGTLVEKLDMCQGAVINKQENFVRKFYQKK